MAAKETVYLTPGGKTVRIRRPRPDPIKILVRKKTERAKTRKRYRRFRGKVPEVSSMWINPHSRIVSVNERKRQRILAARDVFVNTPYFADLQSALDSAEQETRHAQEESGVSVIETLQDVEELDG